MNKKMNVHINFKTSILIMFLLAAYNIYAVSKDPYSGSRIFWDTDSELTLFPSGNYARIIQLQDGRIMAAAESGGGISVCYSSNYGKTWTSPELIVRQQSLIPYAVPDLIQLTDGTILVGFNPRPSSPYSENRKFGIRTMISHDNGKNWEGPIFIFDAQYISDNGCWEPSFLELPSGELHCYFANENDFTLSNEQCISMCRSFDKGKTWSDPIRISFRPGSRDGMPVPIITDNGEIAVIIEDNGWPGYSGFRATTVRCPLSDNWNSVIGADSPNRNIIFANTNDKKYKSAAPYLRKLQSGETIASWQGDYGDRKGVGESQYDMFVAVGDKDAKNFKAISAPFNLSLSQHSLWNSIAVVGDGSVIALGSIGDPNTGNAIKMIKGYPKTYFEADFGTPVLDGSASGDTWTYKNAQQVFMGNVTKNKTTADFLYDNKYLYFTARVIDRDIYTDKVDNDGIFLSLDLENACDTYPQKGMFQFFLDVNGNVTMKYGDNNNWHDADNTEDITYIVNTKSFYYDMEIAIPWKLLGYETAPVQNQMRVNLEIRNRKDGAVEKEIIPETLAKQSWSWMEFRLNKTESGIQTPLSDNQNIIAYTEHGTLNIKSNTDISGISVYASNGALLHQVQNYGNSYQIPLSYSGNGILKIKLANGNTVSKKILFP